MTYRTAFFGWLHDLPGALCVCTSQPAGTLSLKVDVCFPDPSDSVNNPKTTYPYDSDKA